MTRSRPHGSAVGTSSCRRALGHAQSQLMINDVRIVQVRVALLLAGFGSVGALAVRVAVTA